jgi:hypothetical protein
MHYLRVRWVHSHPDEPVELYSELDDRRWELRKVEVFPDGAFGYAGPEGATSNTVLGLEPIPTRTQIASDPQFEPEEISQAEFEAVWEQAHRASPQRGAKAKA